MPEEQKNGCGNPLGCLGWLIVAGLIIWGWTNYQSKVSEDQYYQDVAASAEDEAYQASQRITKLESRVEELEKNTESLREAVEIIGNYLGNQ